MTRYVRFKVREGQIHAWLPADRWNGEVTVTYGKQEKPMHPSTEHILQFFNTDHMPPYLKCIAEPFRDLAHTLANGVLELPSNPETTACLRKLLEAKDCAVRAKIAG